MCIQILLTFTLALVLFGMTADVQAASRDALWKEVNEAMEKGLPQTAIEKLNLIIEGARKDKAWGELAKAIGRKLVLEANRQGNKPEEKIRLLEAEIERAPKELVPLFDTLLAHWYWHYYQANRWRFLQRTATTQPPGKDFTTYDLPRLFALIDRQFQKALAAADTLKQTPVSSYDDLLEKGTLPDAYRPTLFDFIAHEALGFYTSGEQAGAKPEGAYELPADGPIFASAQEYLGWHRTFAIKDFPDSPVVRALDLYGQLLRFHEKDEDPTAWIDADLARLVYGQNVAVGDAKDERYLAALQALIERWADHEISAMALYHRGTLLEQQQKYVEARENALRGKSAHPNSPGGKLCQNLIQQIEAKSLQVVAEDVWAEPWPKVAVTYRNVTNIHFRLLAAHWEQATRGEAKRPHELNSEERAEFLAQPPVREWSHPLPPTTDYRPARVELPVPTDLRPGYYYLATSTRADFGGDDNEVNVADIWVSDLALVTRTRAGRIEGFVLSARSGEPVAGAEVEAWFPNDRGQRRREATVTSDAEGFFAFPEGTGKERPFLLRARKGEQAVAPRNDWWVAPRPQERSSEQTVFFTDRALYRPGQIVQYKGICLAVDTDAEKSSLLAGREITVVFRDPNRRELARAKHRCNDFGSFAGSFNAPREGVTGRFSISVDGTARGQTAVQIEEYKRPKFQVNLDAPKTAPRLNDEVRLEGHALAYTGAAIDSAPVKYRVVRSVRFPPWFGWYRWRPPAGPSQEIAHGTTRTAVDGSFSVLFPAKPDRTVPEADQPTFDYEVFADVTDSAGETRSANRRIHVGYTALEATLSADDWIAADQTFVLTTRTTTLDNEPQVAEGTIRIHRLRQPDRVQRPPLGSEFEFGPQPRGGRREADLSDPNSWEIGEVAVELPFTTATNGLATHEVKLAAGPYRALLETQDRFGKQVKAMLPLQVLDPNATRLDIRVPQIVAAPSWSLEPGEELNALWGTGYDAGRAFIEIEREHRVILRFWTRPGQTQQQIRQPISEAMRGGFTLHITQVRENRAYLESRHVDVPWNNKQLDVRWEHFTSKLEPGQKETWTAVIQPVEGRVKTVAIERDVAELVGALYDASLDQFRRHSWPQSLRNMLFRQDHSTAQSQFASGAMPAQQFLGGWSSDYQHVDIRYRHYPEDLTTAWFGYGAVLTRSTARRQSFSRGGEVAMEMNGVAMPAPMMAAAPAAPLADGAVLQKGVAMAGMPVAAEPGGGGEPPAPPPDLSQVTARQNLQETAFFFPQLTSDSNGVVRLTFTMPEALTEWRFLGFAHDRHLRSGYIEDKTVTAKDLMVQPNPPRFLREGDLLEFTVKVSNASDTPQTGRVRLNFTEALSAQSADRALGIRAPELDFDVPPKESRSFSWRIEVPDGLGFLTYKAVAASTRVSDGEEGCLPVLSRRIFVTESLPLPIRGPATKKFTFTSLAKSGKSDTLQHQSLTVQMVSNPAWYAVMALPFLMEFPHECSEQTFNRFYANTLARFIANADPRIRRVFEQWKNTPALDSPLEKNQDLKSVLIQETPWLRQAQSESQARRNVGLLFDENRLTYETSQALRKLTEMQLGDGLWPWFPGGRGNEYITLYIVTGFGRLRHLGADPQIQPALRAIGRLDTWMEERYREILRHSDKEAYVPSSTDALYLYGRSFFLKDRPIANPHQEAVEFFLARARQHWLKTDNRQSQGHLALALRRWGGADNRSVAGDILKSIKERSVTEEEMGRFWRETELSWWWYRAPIETQALMIEAFAEVAEDAAAVEDCKVWLLKQKQTQDWKTTKATADAVYALLLRGRDLLASTNLVEVELGGVRLPQRLSKPGAAPAAIEAGTGFYEKRFVPSEIRPKLGEVTVRKVDAGVAWGSVHWQYLEDMSKVVPYAGTPLKLQKALFVKKNTDKGPVLEPVRGPIAVGDELVVRIELRVDRDMEYVHLKDQRGSGTEPVNVLSQYRYQDGLAYYESTRDTASHFFIDYLPKGTYVFEYSSRVQHRGVYQTGVAAIQCMYAPEFNSHSESLKLTVQ